MLSHVYTAQKHEFSWDWLLFLVMRVLTILHNFLSHFVVALSQKS